MNSVQKLLLSLFLFVLISFINTQPVFASSLPISSYTPNEYVNIMMSGLTNYLSCQIAGFSLSSPNLCPAVPAGGALGQISSLISTLYQNPPTSTAYYLANMATDLGIISPAYAQSNIGGSGDGVLLPILKVWEVMRNLAYLVFIVIFVAVGFMVMFRQKINPQTVIGVQQALPGLVIGLVLVTFSYFLSALIVDSAFVGTKLVVGIFQQIDLPNRLDASKNIEDKNIVDLYKSFILGTDTKQPPAGIPNQSLGLSGLSFGNQPRNWFDWENILLGIAGGIISTIVVIILVIALLIQMLRLLWALISAYITIFITTIFSPLIILIASIPGRGGLLSMWWKTMLANALIFPAIFATFLLAGLFLYNVDGKSFVNTLPLFGSLPTQYLAAIVGYGILLMTPGIPNMVKNALGVKDQDFGKVAVGGFMAGAGAGRAGFDTATSRFQAERKAYGEAMTRSRVMGPGAPGAPTPAPPRRYEFWKWGL